MPPVSKPVRRKKKRKVGRPAFSRKDIPEEFFRYYDAYRFGFWNKREFAEYLLVSRPTLDRYFKTIQAKPPVVSKAENKRLRKEMAIGEGLREAIDFYKALKERNGEPVKSTGIYANAAHISFRLQLREMQRRAWERKLAEIHERIAAREIKRCDDDDQR